VSWFEIGLANSVLMLLTIIADAPSVQYIQLNVSTIHAIIKAKDFMECKNSFSFLKLLRDRENISQQVMQKTEAPYQEED